MGLLERPLTLSAIPLQCLASNTSLVVPLWHSSQTHPLPAPHTVQHAPHSGDKADQRMLRPPQPNHASTRPLTPASPGLQGSPKTKAWTPGTSPSSTRNPGRLDIPETNDSLRFTPHPLSAQQGKNQPHATVSPAGHEPCFTSQGQWSAAPPPLWGPRSGGPSSPGTRGPTCSPGTLALVGARRGRGPSISGS